MAFALKLVGEETAIRHCAPLREGYEQQRKRFIALLSEAGYEA